MLQLGQTLGLSVVAEGVETLEQADALRAMGCALAQGYLFSKPVDAEQIDAMLEEHRRADASDGKSPYPAIP